MFHSRFNRVLAVVTWLVCLATLAAIAFPGPNSVPLYIPLIVLIAWIAWVALWRPKLSLDDDAITVDNVFATTVVPWAALIQVETRYALTLVTPNRRVAVTVAPAPGRLTTALSRRDMKGVSAPVGSDGSVQAGDLPTSDSGAAAHLVRARWQNLLDNGRIEVGTADAAIVDRRINWPVIATSTILVIAAVAAIALS